MFKLGDQLQLEVVPGDFPRDWELVECFFRGVRPGGRDISVLMVVKIENAIEATGWNVNIAMCKPRLKTHSPKHNFKFGRQHGRV